MVPIQLWLQTWTVETPACGSQSVGAAFPVCGLIIKYLPCALTPLIARSQRVQLNTPCLGSTVCHEQEPSAPYPDKNGVLRYHLGVRLTGIGPIQVLDEFREPWWHVSRRAILAGAVAAARCGTEELACALALLVWLKRVRCAACLLSALRKLSSSLLST